MTEKQREARRTRASKARQDDNRATTPDDDGNDDAPPSMSKDGEMSGAIELDETTE